MKNTNTLQDKIAFGHVLSVSELMAATGYSRAAIKRIKPPLAVGKIRLQDFWRHVETLAATESSKTAALHVVPSRSNTDSEDIRRRADSLLCGRERSRA